MFTLLHLASDVDAGQTVGGVSTDGDDFLESAGHFPLTVVGDVDFTLLARFDGRLGEIGHRASAGGDGLLDDEGLVARVFEHKFVADGLVFGEVSEIVRGFLEGDDGLCRSTASSHHAERKEESKDMLHIGMLLMSIWKYFNVYSANVGLKSELNILSHEKSEVYRADSVFLQGRKPVFWLGAWHLCSMQGNVPHAAQRNLVLRYSDGCHRCTSTLPARCGTFLSNETYNYQPETLLEMVTTQVAFR